MYENNKQIASFAKLFVKLYLSKRLHVC